MVPRPMRSGPAPADTPRPRFDSVKRNGPKLFERRKMRPTANSFFEGGTARAPSQRYRAGVTKRTLVIDRRAHSMKAKAPNWAAVGVGGRRHALSRRGFTPSAADGVPSASRAGTSALKHGEVFTTRVAHEEENL